MCISISKHILTHFGCVLLVFYLPHFIINEEACTFTYLGETKQLTGVCTWSAWLRWNCTCCGNGVNFNITRKRAICCAKGLDKPTCLHTCNYAGENATDTHYGTCKDNCAEKYNQSLSTSCLSLAVIPDHLSSVPTLKPIVLSTAGWIDSSAMSVRTNVTKSFAISSSSKLSSTIESLPRSDIPTQTLFGPSSLSTVRESIDISAGFYIHSAVQALSQTAIPTPALIGPSATSMRTTVAEPLGMASSSASSPIIISSASHYTPALVDRHSTHQSIWTSMQPSVSLILSSETMLPVGTTLPIRTHLIPSISPSFSSRRYLTTMTTSVIENVLPTPSSTANVTLSEARLTSSERRSVVSNPASSSSFKITDEPLKSSMSSVNYQNEYQQSSVTIKNNLAHSHSRNSMQISMPIDPLASTIPLLTNALRTQDSQIPTGIIESGSHTKSSRVITASSVHTSSFLLHQPTSSSLSIIDNGLSTDVSRCKNDCSERQEHLYQECVQKCSERLGSQATREQESDSHKGNAGVIAGSVIGSLLAIALLVGAFVLFKHRRKLGQKVAPVEHPDPMTIDADSDGETIRAQRKLGMVGVKDEQSTYIHLPPIDTSHS